MRAWIDSHIIMWYQSGDMSDSLSFNNGEQMANWTEVASVQKKKKKNPSRSFMNDQSAPDEENQKSEITNLYSEIANLKKKN